MIRYRPGNELKTFEISRNVNATDEKGRVTTTSGSIIGTFKGMISQARQSEQDRWKQMGHPISHTIVIKGISGAQAEDTLLINGRFFYVQGKDNPAELGIYEILYCDERMGV